MEAPGLKPGLSLLLDNYFILNFYYKFKNFLELQNATKALKAIDTIKTATGTSKPLKKASCPNWTSNSSGTTTKRESCVVARTVLTRSESTSENALVTSTAETAPRIEATTTIVGTTG